MTQQFRWSEEQTTRLMDMHKAGFDRQAIARALNIEPARVKGRLIYLGLVPNRVIEPTDIDLAQQMHEMARLRFSVDECTYVLGIDLPKAFQLVEWYCVRFEEVPVDLETVKQMLGRGRSHADIAKVFGCSYQKIAALAKAIRRRK